MNGLTFERMLGLEPDWDGYGSPSPKPESVEAARSWLDLMRENAQGISDWAEPHISSDEHGDVAFEWWNENKALTVYVSEDEATYIKGWGLNIEHDMEDGEINTSEDRCNLWRWLVNR